MQTTPLSGLVAATYTPLMADGSLKLDVVPAMVDHLLDQGITGLYVCGSTGEGMSLSSDERRLVTEAYVDATAGRVPVIVQVGHNSVSEARSLAAHALQAGADVISATCPSYFRVNDVQTLVDCMAEIAGGAPELPFYYYHIPILTGSALSMPEFLQCGRSQIPNLIGLKYTDTKLFEFQQCLDVEGGDFDVVWGCDEMLLGALATGAVAAIGSTYNIAAPLYGRLIEAFQNGDLVEARRLQSLSIQMIYTIGRYPFHAAMKSVLAMQGLDVGGCRLPQSQLPESDSIKLRQRLDAIGFFDWSH